MKIRKVTRHNGSEVGFYLYPKSSIEKAFVRHTIGRMREECEDETVPYLIYKTPKGQVKFVVYSCFSRLNTRLTAIFVEAV